MATLKYSDLETKYKDFDVPDFSINVGGSDVKTDDFPINELNIIMSAGFDMSSCEFMVAGIFSEEQGKFEKDIYNTFKPGKVVIVKMGYSSTLQGVFKGYINSLIFDFNSSKDGAFVTVKCLDAKGALVNNKTWVNYGEKKMVDIVKDIIETKCKDFATVVSPESDFDEGKTGVHKESPEIKENLDDYNYVIEYAKKTNNSFCVIYDQLYFCKNLFENINKDPNVELKWAESLLSFVTEIDLSQQIGAVKIYGYDSITQEAFLSETKNEDSKLASVAKNKTMVLVNPHIINQKQADAVGKAKMASYASQLVHCNGKSIGIPDIQAGNKIKVSGMGTGVDGVYSLIHVTHRMDENGYTTFFDGLSSKVETE